MLAATPAVAAPIRFILLGGFLSAGKTTIVRLTQHHLAQRLLVAVVTNDQAADLVDTLRMRTPGRPAAGFRVGDLLRDQGEVTISFVGSVS